MIGAYPATIEVAGLKTCSLNKLLRMDRWKRAAYTKNVRAAVRIALHNWCVRNGFSPARRPPTPAVVRLTRVAPADACGRHGLDLFDNAPASQKAVVDEVAAVLGIDDGRSGVRWEMRQARGPYAVRIEFDPQLAEESDRDGSLEP